MVFMMKNNEMVGYVISVSNSITVWTIVNAERLQINQELYISKEKNQN